jgi:hypothetical protein
MEQMICLTVQGRSITTPDIELVRNLLDTNPSWNRTRLSKELCLLWDWRRANGEYKDIACRSLLRKLEQLGYIQLPKSHHRKGKRSPVLRDNIRPILHSQIPIQEPLNSLYPIELQRVEKDPGLNEFKYYISTYHYLGWSGTVGENLKYLFFDVHKRPLGCMMFGACAWKVKGRDRYIGWNASERMENLSYVVNNNRFLILPWVKVTHLASHILGKISHRLNRDWQEKYQHPVYLVETFVDKERYQGTCYKAANWVHVGVTKGRGKLDIKNQCLLPVKDIWVYPLVPYFRQKLCQQSAISDQRSAINGQRSK